MTSNWTKNKHYYLSIVNDIYASFIEKNWKRITQTSDKKERISHVFPDA